MKKVVETTREAENIEPNTRELQAEIEKERKEAVELKVRLEGLRAQRQKLKTAVSQEETALTEQKRQLAELGRKLDPESESTPTGKQHEQQVLASGPQAREKKFKLVGNIKSRQNQVSEEKFSVYSAKSRQLLATGTSDEGGNVDMFIQEEYVYIVLDSEPGRKHRVRADPAYPAKMKQG